MSQSSDFPYVNDVTYETANAGEAAYLCLLGYDHPTCRQLSPSVVKFVFPTVRHEDVIRFSNAEPVYIAPLLLLEQREKLIGEARALLRSSPLTPAAR